MTRFARLRAWLKTPLWFWFTTVNPHQQFTDAQAAGYQLGYAHGEHAGATRAFASVEEIVRARGGNMKSMDEVTQADIDEARKVRVH